MAPGTTSSPARPALLLAALAGALVLLVLGVARAGFVIDDAYISFRYARHWAEWGVPAYNPGEDPPVEGYSNPSWVWLLRHAHAAGQGLEDVARGLGLLAGAGTLVLLALLARGRRGPGDGGAAVACLVLAVFPPFVWWCSGGLETSLFGLLALGTFALTASSLPALAAGTAAGIVATLLALTRPEGVALAPVLLVAGLVARREAAGRLRLVLGFALCLALGYGLFLAWRHGVHGALWPNTVRAKTGAGTAVLGRGLRTVASYHLLLLAPLVSLLAPLTAPAHLRRLALGAWLVLGAGLAENVLVGGDWMPMFRLLAPFAAFHALCLVLALERVPAGRLLALALGLVAALPGLGLGTVPRAWLEPLYFRAFQRGYESEWERRETGLRNVETFLAIGRGLDELASPGDSITLGAIGAVGWASDVVVHDRNGLVDREVARTAPVRPEASAGHDRRVPRVFFADREPTWWEAILVEGAIPSLEARGGRRAALALAARLEAEDRVLLDSSLPQFHVLTGEPARTLVLLRRAGPGEGRELWRALGL